MIYETYVTMMDGDRIEYGYLFKRAEGVDDVMFEQRIGTIPDKGEETGAVIEREWQKFEWVAKAVCDTFDKLFAEALPKFVRGYITCALWSSSDESDESGGEPLDSNYTADDLTAECRKRMEDDCADFVRANWLDLILYTRTYAPTGEYEVWECAGHDFWLTRNGHGAGYWDRGLRELGDRLTKAAKVYSSADLFLNEEDRLEHY